MTGCLLDTGPLVTLLDRSEPDHLRLCSFMTRLQGQRLVTTGAIVTEAFHFLSAIPNGAAALTSFLDASATEVRDAFTPEALNAAVRLMAKYADTPMDFPDATLVWLAEHSGIERIPTFDRRGFLTYRFARNRRFKLVFDP